MPKMFIGNTLRNQVRFGWRNEEGGASNPITLEAGTQQLIGDVTDSYASAIIDSVGLIHHTERAEGIMALVFSFGEPIPAQSLVDVMDKNQDAISQASVDDFKTAGAVVQSKLAQIARESDLSNTDVELSIAETGAPDGTKGDIKASVKVKA